MQHQDEIRKKILGCWLGKTVGGVLGTPWESDPRTHALTWYDPMPDQALPNDDLELQVMYLDGLSRMKEPVVNRELLADLWLQHMNFHVPGNPPSLVRVAGKSFRRRHGRGDPQ